MGGNRAVETHDHPEADGTPFPCRPTTEDEAGMHELELNSPRSHRWGLQGNCSALMRILTESLRSPDEYLSKEIIAGWAKLSWILFPRQRGYSWTKTADSQTLKICSSNGCRSYCKKFWINLQIRLYLRCILNVVRHSDMHVVWLFYFTLHFTCCCRCRATKSVDKFCVRWY